MKKMCNNIEKKNYKLNLAPLAGYTDLSFRRIALECGADEVYTEMVSAKALYYGDKKTHTLLDTDGLKNTKVQIFGNDAEIMAQVIKKYINSDDRFIGVDINMGCPAPKIVRNGEGSALLKEPVRAYEIMKACVEASELPVSVKIRLGFECADDSKQIVAAANDAGISEICIHGRTRTQYYEGRADWEAIGELAKMAKMPVIGNGDITDADIAAERLKKYELSGLSIGRGSIGNPWIFSQIKAGLSGTTFGKVNESTLREMMIRHLLLCVEHKGENLGVKEMRKVLPHYVKGLRDSNSFRASVNILKGVNNVVSLINEFFDKLADTNGANA